MPFGFHLKPKEKVDARRIVKKVIHFAGYKSVAKMPFLNLDM